MNSKYKNWTKQEIDFLIEHYQFGIKKCAEKIERSERAIQIKAYKLNLKIKNEFKIQISKYNKEDLEKIISQSYCLHDIIKILGIGHGTNSYKHLRELIKKFDINTSHFLSQSDLRKRNGGKNKFLTDYDNNLDSYFISSSNRHNRTTKNILFRNNLKENKCEYCEQGPIWKNKPLTLILDHINGINTDNRLENLRILCPNCNAQLPTHCSKNRGTYKQKEESIKTSVKIKDIKINGRTEKEIAYYKSMQKIERPSYEQLKEEIKQSSYVQVGKKYGVSDVAIRKWIRFYEKFENKSLDNQ